MNGKEETGAREGKKKNFFSQMGERLREKDAVETARRGANIAIGILFFGVAYIFSGKELIFGASPLGIALLSAAGKYTVGIAVGLLFAFLGKRVSLPYLFAYVTVFFMRLLISYAPASSRTNTPDILRESREKSDLNKERISGREATRTGRVLLAAERLFGIEVGVERSETREERGKNIFFGEGIAFRMLASCVGGFIAGLFCLIESNFSLYDLYGTIFMLLFCPVCVLLFSGISEINTDSRSLAHAVGCASIMTFSVLSADGMYIFGMPLQPMLAMLFTLCASKKRGLPSGILISLLCGLCFDYMYIPLLFVSAVLFCLLSAVKKTVGLAAVCAAVVVWCYYVGRTSGLVGVLPPMLLAIPVYLIFDRYTDAVFPSEKEKTDNIAEGGVYFAVAVSEQRKNEAVRDRLESLSEAFSSLSETFYKLSDRFRRPDALGIRKITDEAFESVCDGCRNRDVCWGADYSDTVEAMGVITSALHTEGRAELSSLPEKFSACCMRREELIEKVNSKCAEATEQIIRSEKISLFASNYDDVTAILRDALRSDGDEYECDTEAAGKIYEYLTSKGFDIRGVVVCGKRNKRVVVKGIGLGDNTEAALAGAIRKTVSDITGSKLTGPVFEVGRDGTLMLLNSAPRYSAYCSHGRIAAGEDTQEQTDPSQKILIDPFEESKNQKARETCGDSTEAFVTGNSYFYSLISDGMGSGADAAFVSGMSVLFIEKMLSAGNRADITLRMLNNFLRSENCFRKKESSVTVDLMELDMMNGTAAFIKSGAAPTYILREGKVYKINSRTMPIGIIKNPDARITKFDMKRGDVAVMISDGCCPDSEDCPWLVELLSGKEMPEGRLLETKAGEMAERMKDEILRAARENSPSEKKMDDISVSVVVVA